jgi:hypothetical protein
MDGPPREPRLDPEMWTQVKNARRWARRPLKMNPEEVEEFIHRIRTDLGRLGVDDSLPDAESLRGLNLHPQMELKLLACQLVIRHTKIDMEQLRSDKSDQARERMLEMAVLVHQTLNAAGCLLIELVERQREIIARHDGDRQRRPAGRRPPLRDMIRNDPGRDRRAASLRALEGLYGQCHEELIKLQRIIDRAMPRPSNFAGPDSSDILQ